LTVKTRDKRRRRSEPQPNPGRELLARYFPAWILLAVVLVMVLPDLLVLGLNAAADLASNAPGAILDGGGAVLETAVDVAGDIASTIGSSVKSLFDSGDSESIAPLFTAEVRYWEDDLHRWADAYDLDPKLLATVMQIESCGYAPAVSSSGAQGLFQVMPMHFASNDDPFDPDTNALNSARVLSACLERAKGNPGLAMACYNGGPSVIVNPYSTWTAETQRYYIWATGIYADALADKTSSATLEAWLAAGGINLCDLASAEQNPD
jgi:hypothetical protein